MPARHLGHTRHFNAVFIAQFNDGARVVLDLVEIDDEVAGPGAQRLLDQELALRQAGQTGNVVGDVTRHRRGYVYNVDVRLRNVNKVETDGIDVEASYSFGDARFGDFSARIRWTHVLEFKKDWNDGEGLVDRAGDFGYPQDRAQLTVNWNLGDLAATAVGNYVGEQEDQDSDWRGMDSDRKSVV